MLYGSLKVYRVVNLNCYLSPVSFINVRRLPAFTITLIAETTQRLVVDLVTNVLFGSFTFPPHCALILIIVNSAQD